MSSGVGWLSGPSSAAVSTRGTPRCARAREASIERIRLALDEAVDQPAPEILGTRSRGERDSGIGDRRVDAVDVERVLHHAVADAIAPAGARLVAEEHDLRRVQLHARRTGCDG